VPPELLHIHRTSIRQHDIDDIPALLSIAQTTEGDSFNLVTRLHDPLGEKKSGRELEVVTGGAHGDANRRTVHSDLERLLAGEIIKDVPASAGFPLEHLRRLRTLGGMPHQSLSAT
jgi:hypothetical protein